MYNDNDDIPISEHIEELDEGSEVVGLLTCTEKGGIGAGDIVLHMDFLKQPQHIQMDIIADWLDRLNNMYSLLEDEDETIGGIDLEGMSGPQSVH